MSVSREELHDLIDGLPDDEVAALLAAARPSYSSAGSTHQRAVRVDRDGQEAENARTDDAERVDDLLPQGFGRA